MPKSQHAASRPLPRGLGAVLYIPPSNPSSIRPQKPFNVTTSVLMNNPLTPSNSDSIPKTIPGTGPSTLDIQPQNISVAQLTPDEVVDRFLLKAKSPLEEGEVRKVVDMFGEVSAREHIIPADRHVQPVDDRCCSHTSK